MCGGWGGGGGGACVLLIEKEREGGNPHDGERGWGVDRGSRRSSCLYFVRGKKAKTLG